MPGFDFPPRLALARTPTPLVPLLRFPLPQGAPRVWVKRDDLTGAIGTGNKVRKLEFLLADAIARGADAVITCGGLQSNHCRATALFCAELGLRCRLVLRGEPEGLPDGNLFLDHLLGATVECHPVHSYVAHREELLERAAASELAAGRVPYLIPTGASDGTGIWGYISAAQELAYDFARVGIRPTHIVVASGSGGTQAGLSVGCAAYLPEIKVVGVAVCDDAAYFHAKVAADVAEWQSRYGVSTTLRPKDVEVWDEYIGPGYGRASPEVLETIRQLARCEGLVLDPVYTGKAFHGLLQEIRKGRFAGSGDVVFMHTGGAFGLMAQREAVMAPAPT